MHVQRTSTDRCLRSSVEDIIEQLVGCGVGNCRQIGAVREAELASVERLVGKMRPDAETVRLPSVPSYRTCCTTPSNGVQFRTDCRIDNSSSSGESVPSPMQTFWTRKSKCAASKYFYQRQKWTRFFLTFYFLRNTAHILRPPAYFTENLAEDFARGL